MAEASTPLDQLRESLLDSVREQTSEGAQREILLVAVSNAEAVEMFVMLFALRQIGVNTAVAEALAAIARADGNASRDAILKVSENIKAQTVELGSAMAAVLLSRLEAK